MNSRHYERGLEFRNTFILIVCILLSAIIAGALAEGNKWMYWILLSLLIIFSYVMYFKISSYSGRKEK